MAKHKMVMVQMAPGPVVSSEDGSLEAKSTIEKFKRLIAENEARRYRQMQGKDPQTGKPVYDPVEINRIDALLAKYKGLIKEQEKFLAGLNKPKKSGKKDEGGGDPLS